MQVYNALNHNEIEPCACLQTAELLNAEVQNNRTLVIHAGDLVSCIRAFDVWLAMPSCYWTDVVAACAGLLVVSDPPDG